MASERRSAAAGPPNAIGLTVSTGDQPPSELLGRVAPRAPLPSASTGEGRGNIFQVLDGQHRIVELDDGDGRTLIVELLRYHRVIRRKGADVVCKSHVVGDSHD